MKIISVIAVCLFLSFYSYAQTTIDSVRISDSTGVPKNVNKIVTVTGVVTSTTQFGASGPVSLQDSTSGMAVYGSSFSSKVLLGDSVRVSGTDRKSTRLNSSHANISYAVFCLKK